MMGRSPCCAKEGLNRGAWTKTEDIILSEYIRIHGDGGWRSLPKKAGLKRCGKSCRLRWLNYLRPDIKRGDISPAEEELIIRLHRLLGNRWSLIAGRLPGRTDNEIKNYWNTRLSKKLLLSMSKPQCKSRKNLKSKAKPSPIQNRVFKTTPVKITSTVRLSGTARPNGSMNSYGCSNPSSDEASKLCNVKETTNFSESLCDHLGIDTEARISTSSMSSLPLERSPHSSYFGADAAPLAESLLDLNELGFTVSDDPRIEEFYDHTQHLDWIHELDYTERPSPQSLSLLLLESDDEREERLGDHGQIP